MPRNESKNLIWFLGSLCFLYSVGLSSLYIKQTDPEVCLIKVAATEFPKSKKAVDTVSIYIINHNIYWLTKCSDVFMITRL